MLLQGRGGQCDLSPGDGATHDDLLFDTEHACMRAERLGADPEGRTYFIALAATDSAGNVAMDVATVHVPHDQRGERRCEAPAGPVGGVGLLPRASLPLGPDAREGRYVD